MKRSPDVSLAGHSRRGEQGFSLVAMLAGTTIMLILMGAAVPTWKYIMKDAREEELLFRGIQIADAIERYQKKNGNAPPPSLEVLVKGRYLRKAYTEPFSKNGKWRFIRPGEAVPVSGLPAAPGAPPAPTTTVPSPSPGSMGAAGAPAMILGGFVGVASTNKDKSLRIFNGRTRYSEWLFIAGQPHVIGKQSAPVVAPPQGGAPGTGPQPGGPAAPPGPAGGPPAPR